MIVECSPLVVVVKLQSGYCVMFSRMDIPLCAYIKDFGFIRTDLKVGILTLAEMDKWFEERNVEKIVTVTAGTMDDIVGKLENNPSIQELEPMIVAGMVS